MARRGPGSPLWTSISASLTTDCTQGTNSSRSVRARRCTGRRVAAVKAWIWGWRPPPRRTVVTVCRCGRPLSRWATTPWRPRTPDRSVAARPQGRVRPIAGGSAGRWKVQCESDSNLARRDAAVDHSRAVVPTGSITKERVASLGRDRSLQSERVTRCSCREQVRSLGSGVEATGDRGTPHRTRCRIASDEGWEGEFGLEFPSPRPAAMGVAAPRAGLGKPQPGQGCAAVAEGRLPVSVCLSSSRGECRWDPQATPRRRAGPRVLGLASPV